MKVSKILKNPIARAFLALVILTVFVYIFSSGRPFVQEHPIALLIAFFVIVAVLDLGP